MKQSLNELLQVSHSYCKLAMTSSLYFIVMKINNYKYAIITPNISINKPSIFIIFSLVDILENSDLSIRRIMVQNMDPNYPNNRPNVLTYVQYNYYTE